MRCGVTDCKSLRFVAAFAFGLLLGLVCTAILRSPSLGLLKQQLDVAAQVIDSFGCGPGAVRRFGQNERALQNGLRVETQARGGTWRIDAVLLHRLADVAFEARRMPCDGALAGLPNGGIAVVGLLHHGADEARELGYPADQQGLAEIDVR